MPYVDVYVELDDIETKDLIAELKGRGYITTEKDKPTSGMQDVIWRYTNGYIEDAMMLLEREYPELYGISRKIRSE